MHIGGSRWDCIVLIVRDGIRGLISNILWLWERWSEQALLNILTQAEEETLALERRL